MINKNKSSMNEGMFSQIDQIRQDSNDVRDFVKKVLSDKEFKSMSKDVDFIKYIKSIYEGTVLDEEHVKFSIRTSSGSISTGSVQTSPNESVINEKKYNFKKDALTDYFKGKLSAEELDKVAKDSFGVGIATKKELHSFLTNKFTQDTMSDTYGIPSNILVKRARDLVKFAEGVNEATKFAGWIAFDHKGNKLEIKKSEAKDLYNAKLLAIKKLKVPKSKESMLAIKPAYNESINEVSNPDVRETKFGNLRVTIGDTTYEVAYSADGWNNPYGLGVVGKDDNFLKMNTPKAKKLWKQLEPIISKWKRRNESVVNEGNNIGHYERVGNQTIVDSNFVNNSKGIVPNSELVHLGMGDFALKSPSGNIEFNRSGKLDGIGQDFVGRPHRMTDDKNGKLVDVFLKLMLKKKKAILSMSESVNEANKPGDRLTHKHNPKIEIELIEPTNKGWKVYQIEKGKKKIAYFDKQDISGNNSLFESLNEAASLEAMGIAALTGTRGSAVEDFINKHNLDGAKLFKSIKSANLKGRLNFASALAGKDGNSNQKLTIKLFKKKFNESVSEGKDDFMARHGKADITLKKGYKHHTEDELTKLYDKVGKLTKDKKIKKVDVVFEVGGDIKEDKFQISQLKKKVNKSETKFYDVLSTIENKMGSKKYRLFIEKSLKDFDENPNQSEYRTNASIEEKLFQLS